MAGDVGGGVRAYRQRQEEVRQDGRPTCPGPPRAHGTLKYTHPKDPTRPLLQQVCPVVLVFRFLFTIFSTAQSLLNRYMYYDVVDPWGD